MQKILKKMTLKKITQILEISQIELLSGIRNGVYNFVEPYKDEGHNRNKYYVDLIKLNEYLEHFKLIKDQYNL